MTRKGHPRWSILTICGLFIMLCLNSSVMSLFYRTSVKCNNWPITVRGQIVTEHESCRLVEQGRWYRVVRWYGRICNCAWCNYDTLQIYVTQLNTGVNHTYICYDIKNSVCKVDNTTNLLSFPSLNSSLYYSSYASNGMTVFYSLFSIIMPNCWYLKNIVTEVQNNHIQ